MILRTLQESFVNWYGRLSKPDWAADIVNSWSQRSSYARGKEIRITDGGREISGITQGLELDGALRVETETGKITIVRAGDVSVRSR